MLFHTYSNTDAIYNRHTIFRMQHKKQSPKKTKISRLRQGILCCILQLMSKDVAYYSKNFIPIFGRKQKLQLSKLKT